MQQLVGAGLVLTEAKEISPPLHKSKSDFRTLTKTEVLSFHGVVLEKTFSLRYKRSNVGHGIALHLW